MVTKAIRFISLLSTVLYAGFGLAHLWELPNKINRPKADYLTVQQNYRGWAFAGIIGVIALVSTAISAFLVRQRGRVFWLTLAGVASQVVPGLIFARFIAPANTQTNQWRELPENWAQLRNQWEYSHATNALIAFAGTGALLLSVVIETDGSRRAGTRTRR